MKLLNLALSLTLLGLSVSLTSCGDDETSCADNSECKGAGECCDAKTSTCKVDDGSRTCVVGVGK